MSTFNCARICFYILRNLISLFYRCGSNLIVFQSRFRDTLPSLLLLQSHPHEERQRIRAMDDALGGVFVLRHARDIQRCFSVVVSLLLRGQSVHRVLAVESDDEGLVDSVQEIHSSEALAARAGDR